MKKLFTVTLKLLFGILTIPAFGQEINGVILDQESRQPLIGATVQVDGTQNGVITDVNGAFSIQPSSSEGSLIISYVGFKTQIIPFDAKTDNLSILLLPDDTILKDVIVEARRTAKEEHKTSLSITNFGSQEVQSLGINNPSDLASYTPGFYSKPTVGSSNPVYTIRGVGFNDFTSIQNPGTSVYLNGVIIPYHTMMSFQLLDIDRIEVLKGPQGTLYGRNSTAGAINIYTKKYGEELNGNFQMDYSSWKTLEFEGAMGGKLTETLSVRAALSTFNRFGGYQTNRVNNDTEYGSIDRRSGRLRLDWRPSTNVNLSFDVHGGVDKSDPVALQHIATFDPQTFQEPCDLVAQGVLAEEFCINAAGYSDPDGNPYAGDYSVTDGGLDNTAFGYNLTADIDFGKEITLTFITGFESFDRDQLQDIDAAPTRFLDVTFIDETNSFTQELRLSSDQSKNFKYVLGAFYSIDEVDALQSIDATDLVGTVANVTNDQKTSSFATFVHTEYSFGKFNLLGGLRYSYETKDWSGMSDFVGVGSNSNADKIENDDLSGLIGLEYFIAEDVMLYGNYSSAYRSGGFPGAFTLDPNGLLPFDKEKVYASEVGVKMKSANNKFTGSLAYYHYDWKDLQTQLSVVDPVSNLPSLILTNAGDAIIDGGELSLTWLPVANLLLSGGINVQDGNVEESDDDRLKGKALPNAPDVTFNILTQISVPVGQSKIVVQPDARYTGQRYFTSDNEPIFQDEAYWLFNARISYQFPNTQHEVALWGKNLLDEEYRTEGFNQFGFSGDSYFAIGEPTSLGVSLNFRF